MDRQGLRISGLIPLILAAMSALVGLAPTPAAQAQHLDDYLESQFERKVTLTGVGLVTGLQQTGDVKGSYAAAALYAEQLARVGVPAALDAINKGQGVALVTVTAEIDANWVDGMEYDCQVAVGGGGAESLVGGQLWVTPMKLNLTQLMGRDRGLAASLSSLQPQFPALTGVIGVADGRIDVSDTENQPTRGHVTRGLRVINESPFIAQARASRQIVFDVANPVLRSLTVVSRFVDVINHEMLAEGFADVAEMRSSSQILVRVPERYDVLEFAANILTFGVDVDEIETPAVIRWTPSTGVLVVSGNTRVRKDASVSVQGFAITMLEPETPPTPLNPVAKYDQWAESRPLDRERTGTLRELKTQLDRLRVPTAMQAAVLEQLVNAGMVTATFVNTEESR
ncbi:MAG: flagellar basal body P-ring protein FlgI [Phycisphaerales bacterium]|nr:flagellar basal body P-ring protein FlgI [Phycisphaerales bacterium]